MARGRATARRDATSVLLREPQLDETRDITDLPASPVDHVQAYRELLNFRVIHSRRYLLAAVRRFEKASSVSLDIETSANQGFGESNGAPRLIQVGMDDPVLGREQIVVDCFRVNPQPLVEMLSRPEIEKLVHHSRFERSWFLYHFGAQLPNVYDTCTAWRMIQTAIKKEDPDYVRHSNKLTTVVEKTLGTPLDKAEQASWWGASTLSDDQLEYAALDVAILPPLAERTREVAGWVGLSDQRILADCDKIQESVIKSVEKIRAKRSDESARLRGMLERSRSVAEIDGVWEDSRQVAIEAGARATLTKRYDRLRSKLVAAREAERAERAA